MSADLIFVANLVTLSLFLVIILDPVFGDPGLQPLGLPQGGAGTAVSRILSLQSKKLPRRVALI
jgi:hypothetical protein